MNGDDQEFVNTSSLMQRGPSDLEAADPVFDAELVEELPHPVVPIPLRRRFVRWWRSLPRVPSSLKSRELLTQAAKDTTVAVLRSPWRYLRAVIRGVLAAFRWWRKWVTVRDYREAAEEVQKLADRFTEIRELTLFRWKVTGAAIVALAMAAVVTAVLYGSGPLWAAAFVSSAVLAWLGRRKDGSPGRKPTLAGARTLGWTIDPQVLVDAFRDAKLIGKDETLRLVERATRVGDGWAVTVDLPCHTQGRRRHQTSGGTRVGTRGR